MNNNNGFSVNDLMKFTGNNMNEIFIVLTVLFASISSYLGIITGSFFSMFCCALGLILTMAFCNKIEPWIQKLQMLISKQEKIVLIVLGCLRICIGIILPFLAFFIIGILAGIGYKETRHTETNPGPNNPPGPPNNPPGPPPGEG